MTASTGVPVASRRQRTLYPRFSLKIKQIRRPFLGRPEVGTKRSDVKKFNGCLVARMGVRPEV
jgi:hypothetical protein